MVKCELTIHSPKDSKLHIELDLLKREDAKDLEWQLAEKIQDLILNLIEVFKATGAKEIKKEVIKN